MSKNMFTNKFNYILLFNLALIVVGIWGQSDISNPSLDCYPNRTAQTTQNSCQQRLICYFGNWAGYRPGDGKFSIEDIDPTKCSHLIYAFVEIRENAQLKVFYTNSDVQRKGIFGRFASLKERNPNLKVLISIGGQNDASRLFSQAFRSADQRRNFVESVMSFFRVHGFDGLDIDWEYPKNSGVQAPDDRENFSELLKALRTEFNKCGYILTAHVEPYLSTYQHLYNIEDLIRYLDFIKLGTYNTHKHSESRTGHNSPLYVSSEEVNSRNEFRNIDSAVKTWLSFGVPSNKLIIGVGLFGRTFSLSTTNCNTPRCGSRGPGRAGSFTREAGVLGYNEICLMVNQGNSTVVFDEEAKVPYLISNDLWVSYDNEKSMQDKVNYVLQNGLGGVVVWSVDTDDFRGNCGSGANPLLNSLQTINNCGSSDSLHAQQTTMSTIFYPTTSRISTTSPTQISITIPTPGEISSVNTDVHNRFTGCVLPEYPSGGRYKVLNSKDKLYPDDTASVNTIIEYSCNNNYDVTVKHSFCQEDSTWSTSPSCKKKCRLPESNTVNFICYDSTQQRVECTQFVTSGSIVRFKCKDFHKNTNNFNYAMTCDEGSFDYGAPRCDPDCGLEPAFAETLIIDGIPTKRGTFPWHAAIYELRGTRIIVPTQICGGTLVATTVVISAAHCFYSPSLEKAYEGDMYRVAVGKFHRNWDDETDNTLQSVQKSKIRRIIIPDTYRGSNLHHQSDIAILQLETPITFSNTIHPACLRLNDDEFDKYQTKAGNYGKVAGWGLTTADGDASNELRYLNVPVIGFNQCLKEMEKYSFQQYLTIDKTCAGYLNGSAVCKGDSGGGLVFSDVEITTGLTRWYLRGIVSVGPSDATQLTCRKDTYTAYTKVYHFKEWISNQYSLLNI